MRPLKQLDAKLVEKIDLSPTPTDYADETYDAIKRMVTGCGLEDVGNSYLLATSMKREDYGTMEQYINAFRQAVKKANRVDGTYIQPLAVTLLMLRGIQNKLPMWVTTSHRRPEPGKMTEIELLELCEKAIAPSSSRSATQSSPNAALEVAVLRERLQASQNALAARTGRTTARTVIYAYTLFERWQTAQPPWDRKSEDTRPAIRRVGIRTGRYETLQTYASSSEIPIMPGDLLDRFKEKCLMERRILNPVKLSRFPLGAGSAAQANMRPVRWIFTTAVLTIASTEGSNEANREGAL
ncbi:hypothetical protein T310_9938 [Rasamsonia emersonii CBS 393.64]|uniref:Uncharacterized protein n=1 Tax=Rasamsonia emersonii (strain ATCC 16479 / CBS 393.64 / IMI 116815) TaxID=1408163 RepID=A0A0F4YE48_RASE3|nr:hypothetical protein T310_9938 [Rasamsonia emersonii CBS 393.64]KKA16462.1 hypothetical protein T310_9938 [Rasamsonia emersonii CBS 393.64]